MIGEAFLYHPSRPHWQPIRSTNPSAEEIRALLDDGWKECDRSEFRVRLADWRARRGEGCETCEDPPPQPAA